MSYTLVDDDLIDRLADDAEKEKWLFLEPHPDFKGHWLVQGYSKDVVYDLGELLGPYRAITPAGLEPFLKATEDKYKVAFFEDPTTLLDEFSGLNEPPPFEINSPFPDTINGMLPYQVQGFNALKDLEAGVYRWDTGTGKTVVAAALVKYHLMQDNFDLCLFVVKKSNKVNTVRKLKRLAGVDALHVTGPKQQREQTYEQIITRLDAGEPTVVVLNYEKFRDDFIEWEEVYHKGKQKTLNRVKGFTRWGEAFQRRRLLCVWDEMPSKLKTRTIRLYTAVCHFLYDTLPPKVNYDKRRAPELRQYMLSATPIENNPEDWFNVVRLMDPRIYGTVRDFHGLYVASWSRWDATKPQDWKNFEKMRMTAAHIVHQVDKQDPDIARVFPDVIEEPYYIDWDPTNAAIYDKLEDLAADLHGSEDEAGLNVLALINVCQMICDAPSMVQDSAALREAYEGAVAAWEELGGTQPDKQGSEVALRLIEALGAVKPSNDHHQKLDTLRSLLTEVHPTEKVVIFTAWNKTIMPVLEDYLRRWGVSYVLYTGSERRKQVAQDAFQEDPSVRVFLSSDAGSDSIDLDAGSVVIHYDLPWKWSTFIQRQNRIHRATSTFAKVRYYTLMMVQSVEDRKMEIVQRKQGYHNGLFKPGSGDVSASARLSKSDLLYILTGR